jgi:hypothetical protein
MLGAITTLVVVRVVVEREDVIGVVAFEVVLEMLELYLDKVRKVRAGNFLQIRGK